MLATGASLPGMEIAEAERTGKALRKRVGVMKRPDLCVGTHSSTNGQTPSAQHPRQCGVLRVWVMFRAISPDLDVQYPEARYGCNRASSST